MKAVGGLSMLVGLTVALAASAPAGSLNLEAHESGTGDGTYTKWYTEAGSYDRDFHRTKRIVITVRDLSRKSPPVMIHVYFIAHPQGQSQPLFVYGEAAIPVDLEGRIEMTGEIDAPSLQANIQRYVGLGIIYQSGADIDGWIVVGETDAGPFQIRASRQALLDLATQQPDQLDQMLAEYRRRTGRGAWSRPKNHERIVPPATPGTSKSQRNGRHSEGTQPPAETAKPSRSTPSPGPQMVTLLQPITLQVQYGSITLPAGTKLPLVKRFGVNAIVRYMDAEQAIPVSATDLK